MTFRGSLNHPPRQLSGMAWSAFGRKMKRGRNSRGVREILLGNAMVVSKQGVCLEQPEILKRSG
jgi:hypothetical protein